MISSKFSSNSEVNTSELLENLDYMFSMYYVDVVVTHREKINTFSLVLIIFSKNILRTQPNSLNSLSAGKES